MPRPGPLDLLVHGRERQGANLAFVIAGAALVAAGAVIGIVVP